MPADPTVSMFSPDDGAAPEPVDVNDWDYEWAEEHVGPHVVTYHVAHAPPGAATQRGTAGFIGLNPYVCNACGDRIMDRVPPDGSPTREPAPLTVDVDVDAVLATIKAESPRLLRIFTALAALNLPSGWDARFHDGPFGVVLRRQSDGWVAVLMPSTDGTPRWYLDGRVGAPAGMAASFEEAVAHTIANAPVRITGGTA